jgi:hypothetical protein
VSAPREQRSASAIHDCPSGPGVPSIGRSSFQGGPASFAVRRGLPRRERGRLARAPGACGCRVRHSRWVNDCRGGPRY